MSMWSCEHWRMTNKTQQLDAGAAPRNVAPLNNSSGSNNRDPRHSLPERKSKLPTDGSLALPCRSRFKPNGALSFRTRTAKQAPEITSFEHALRIQSAEFWLRLGEPLEALAEIESLPQNLRRNSRVHQLQMGATIAAKAFQADP
jgi:hypothetical protein